MNKPVIALKNQLPKYNSISWNEEQKLLYLRVYGFFFLPFSYDLSIQISTFCQ